LGQGAEEGVNLNGLCHPGPRSGTLCDTSFIRLGIMTISFATRDSETPWVGTRQAQDDSR
jgi:hypothetical protein